ncbi:MAG: glycosyltransferase family 2 protein [Rhodoferax sp.]|nr:glycosyltransferase family 2 protein [Rhodoferax sp.]
MPYTKPFVTVIVPCFNTAQYLGATLTSVQAQTFRDFEAIMVDDGSTDGTLSIMQDFARRDARFKVISLQLNQGIVPARNVALAQASGEYIAMLDGDDIWTPDALAVRVEIAQRHPAADVIATDFAWFENEPPSQPTGRVGLGPRGLQLLAKSSTRLEPIVLNNPFEMVAKTHFAWVGATLVGRKAMTAVGNFDPQFKGPEDTLLWLRLAQHGSFVFTPRITAFYRQRVGSIVSLLKGPKELHYLKVLDWVRSQPEYSERIGVIDAVAAECHHVCAQYYCRLGEHASGCRHALSAVVKQPKSLHYWRHLGAASLNATRSRPKMATP